MNLVAHQLPQWLLWGANILLAYILYQTIRPFPWRALYVSPRLSLFLGSCAGLTLLWHFKAGLQPGLSYHLLGASLFVLMFGWRLALLGMLLVYCAVLFNDGGDWTALGINMLNMALAPIAVTQGLLVLAWRRFPYNYFIYVLFNGYAAAGVSMLASMTLSVSLLLLFSEHTLDSLLYDYLPFAPFMLFAEGFYTGMLIASLTLTRPDWVASFDDHLYWDGK